jgi:hypothetical protein
LQKTKKDGSETGLIHNYAKNKDMPRKLDTLPESLQNWKPDEREREREQEIKTGRNVLEMLAEH